MCDLKKALDFLKSCTMKDSEDNRDYLKNVVYDKNNGAIVATDGRRLAALMVPPERIAGAANLPDRFGAVALNESSQNFTVYPFGAPVKFPENYGQVIPRGLDHYTGEYYDPSDDDKKEYMFTWRNQAGANSYNYEKEELPAGLCVELARRFLDYKPKYLKLPVYKDTTNEWAVLGDGAGADPLVFFNKYQYGGMSFRIIYVVMPMRGDNLLTYRIDAEIAIDAAFEGKNVPKESYKILAAYLPAERVNIMHVMFRKPGDDLFYTGMEFRDETWYGIKQKVDNWITAK